MVELCLFFRLFIAGRIVSNFSGGDGWYSTWVMGNKWYSTWVMGDTVDRVHR